MAFSGTKGGGMRILSRCVKNGRVNSTEIGRCTSLMKERVPSSPGKKDADVKVRGPWKKKRFGWAHVRAGWAAGSLGLLSRKGGRVGSRGTGGTICFLGDDSVCLSFR